MAWSFEGSWVVLISGTAVGLSLIAWSLHRCWRQRRQEAVEVCKESRVTLLERLEGKEREAVDSASGEEPATAATELAAEVREMEGVLAAQRVEEVEATLFAVGAGMYELKAAAEEVPPVQVPRRVVRRRVAEQLLLWPDADEPLAGAVQPSDFTTTERR